MNETATQLDAASLALGLAEKELANALAKLQTEEERLKAARVELASLTDQVKASDPDADAKAFSRLVQARDTARGREEALQVRVEGATKARDEREAVANAARLDLLRAQLENERAELRASEASTTTKVREGVAGLLEAIRGHQAQVNRVQRAYVTVHKASGQSTFDIPSVHTAWSDIPLHDTPSSLTSIGKQHDAVLRWERSKAAGTPQPAADTSLAEPAQEDQLASRESTKAVSGATVATTTHAGQNLHRSVRINLA